MKANLFDVLNRMNTEHEGSVHAYFSNNIENVNAGYALTTRYRAARNEGRGYMHGRDSRQVLYTWWWVMRSTLLEWRPDAYDIP